VKGQFNCPGCSNKHDVSTITFSQLSTIEAKVFHNMLLSCDKAKHKTPNKDQNITLREVINQPVEEEPSELESRAAVKVISRLLHQEQHLLYQQEIEYVN
jgi:hypothetical protein